jgi:hypothetical protein
LAGVPLYIEKLPFDLVADPKESHLHGSGALFFHCVVGNACGCFVVAVDWRRWLFVAEFCEDESENDAFFDVHEQGTQFGFGCGCDYNFEDSAERENGTIERDRFFVRWC